MQDFQVTYTDTGTKPQPSIPLTSELPHTDTHFSLTLSKPAAWPLSLNWLFSLHLPVLYSQCSYGYLSPRYRPAQSWIPIAKEPEGFILCHPYTQRLCNLFSAVTTFPRGELWAGGCRWGWASAGFSPAPQPPGLQVHTCPPTCAPTDQSTSLHPS